MPEESKFLKYQDKNADGLIDDCPDDAGLAEFNGCPDRDGDKIIDKEDDCPKTPGPAKNNGCPIITKEQKAIIDTAFTNLEFVHFDIRPNWICSY